MFVNSYMITLCAKLVALCQNYSSVKLQCPKHPYLKSSINSRISKVKTTLLTSIDAWQYNHGRRTQKTNSNKKEKTRIWLRLTLQHKIQCSTIVSKLPFGNVLLIKYSPNIRYFIARKINYDMKGQTEITKMAAEPVSQSWQSNSGAHVTTRGLLLYKDCKGERGEL